jgi:DNA (cytosine-5)-methyltransferase 1
MGFDARWGVVSAADVGAPHKRDRIWIVGDSSRKRRSEGRDDYGQNDRAKPDTDGQHSREVANSNGLRQLQQERIEQNQRGWAGDCGSEMADSDLSRREQSNKEMARGSSKQFDSNGVQSRENFSNSNSKGSQGWIQDGIVDSQGREKQGIRRFAERCVGRERSGDEWWSIEPDVGRVADGVAARVDRLKAIGNGQVPAVAATAWNLLK